MASDINEEDEDNILYELLIHTEWQLEPEVLGEDVLSQGGSIFYRTLMHTPNNLLSLGSSIINSIWRRSSIAPNIARILNSGSEWQLGVGAQGAVIAVLQDSSLEVRAKKDEYASVVGKNFNLYNDPFPKWRRVAWSSECSMVAVAYSNGAVEIFNTVGASLFTIYPPKFQEEKLQVDSINALAALIFSDVRTEKIKWAAELILIDYHGNVRGYFVSPTEGYQESHNFSFHRIYPHGISAAVEIGSLVIVAGSCQYVNDPSLRNNGLGHGLSLWRMLSDYPYYKQVPTIDEEEYTPPKVKFLSHIPGLEPPPPYDWIFRLCVSPLGRQVAALHSSGSISVWDVPSLRKRKFWYLENQPGFDCQNYDTTYFKKSSGKDFAVGSLKNHLVDVRWWSEKAVILARFSGSVTVCSVNSLTNLLGESPEFFEGVPQISETYDRCFLALEMEMNLLKNRSKSMTLLEPSVSESDETLTEDVEMYEEDFTFMQKAKSLTRSVLFWITDAERFRPYNKRSKVIARTCRLLCLKSTTPLELFTRKIENEEYGEALALAQRYNLDCDLVYQQQWRKSPVTVVTIQDYLTKIRKRSWVLAECLSRVPKDIDAARELILYGLRGTELDTLVGIAEDTNDDEFFVSDLSLEYEEDLDLDPEEAEREAQEWAAKDLKLRKELLSKIDFENLSQEQIEVVRARQCLLKFYDRLSAYEILLGGPHIASENYDPIFYEKFRSQTEIEAAVEMARNYNWRGLEVLFTFHGYVTLLHRLPILSNFPPTMGPYKYRSLLPECDLSGDVFEWEEDSLRDSDWCEDLLCRQAVGIEPDAGLTLLYKKNPELEKFREAPLTADLVSEWYQMRAREMEYSSHFVDAALDLLKLARERNCPDLEELQNTFDVLEILVYEVGLSDLSLKKFEVLSDLEKLTLLLSTSTPETLIQNIRRWGQTFLNHCEKREADLGKRLLREYIVSTANQDLSIPLKTIQHSQQDMADPILSSNEEILRVAIDSVYACEKETQLTRAFAILECLPARQTKKDSKDLRDLHNLVDAMEDHLSIAELLSGHNVLVSPLYIKNVSSDESQVKLLLTRLARTASRRDMKLSDEDWNKLLSDMLEMQQKVFGVVEPQTCFEILTEALLTSGMKEYINFAADLLETRCDGSPVRNPYLQKLPYDTSVKLIVKAAKEYYNSAESYLDNEMILAKHCLQIIESANEEIETELDLISSLEILLDIGINKLPLQVRLCEERLNLIVEALKKRPENYQIGSQILRLASLLRVCGSDDRLRKSKVMTLLAESAFHAQDYEAANAWCLQLVKGGYGEGWEICARLGKCEESRDFSLKAKFLDFALTYASYEYLEELLAARNEVELGVLYSRISDKIDTNESLDSDDGFEDARAESEEESCDEWEDPRPESPPAASKRLLFSVTKNVLSATAASTSSLVSSVANKRMWKHAIGWLRPLRRTPSRSLKSDSGGKIDNNDFLKQGCHAFYANVNPEAYISSLGPSYKSYAQTSISNPALEVSFTLLRIALMEESLYKGNNIQTNIAVLQEVIKGILQEDLLLGVSFLLLLNSPRDVHHIFSSLPRTEVSLQVFLYYYALQIYTFLYPWQKSGIAPVFLHSPNDVITCVRNIIERDTATTDENILTFVEYFRNIDLMINDYVQVQALKKLNAGIDIERFLSEPEYKKDTVLGLAMTLETDVFDLSVSLATKYDVSLWEVYMTQVQYLFDSPEIDCKALKKQIKDREIVSHLIKKPDQFVSFMEKNILYTISGKDHDKLALYFSLISMASNDDAIKQNSKLHINYLNQIKDVAPGLDYKALLTPNSDSLEVLKPVLNAQNVDILAQVAQNIPQKDFVLEPSMVYCAWAQKHFFDLSSTRKPKTANEWIRRFDETKNMLKKLKPKDVNLLIKNFVFSEEGISLVPLEARREMIKKAAKYCKMKSEENKGESESELWENAFSRFEMLEKHLELLRSEVFKSLANSSDSTIKSYAHQFMLSCGEEESLINLSRKVLTDLCSLDVLRSVLAVYPDEVNQVPEDIFLDVFKLTLNNLSKASKGDEELEENLKIFLHLLQELKKYCDEGGDLLDPDEVLDEVRNFAHNEANTLLMRVKIFSASEQCLPFNAEDVHHLQSMKTGNIVTEAFSSPTKVYKGKSDSLSLKAPKNIDTEEERTELLGNLIDNMDSVKKVQSIIELLNIWPKFQPKIYVKGETNPYLCIFLKLLKHPKLKTEKEALSLVLASAKFGLKERELNDECIQILIKKLLKLFSEESLKCAFKIALLSSHRPSQEEVIEKYSDVQMNQNNYYDEELLKLILEKNVVVDILHTCLYGPIVSYVNETENTELRKSIIKDLESSNHWMEASSLAMYSSSVPRAFKTASAAVKAFKKLF